MGQISVVTGGVGGIGAAIATKLKNRGDTVVIVDRVRYQGNDKSDVISLQLDLLDEVAVGEATNQILDRHGKIDNLINCAAVIGHRSQLWEQDSNEFFEIIQNNVFSTFITCKAVIPAMISANYGRIVNFGAIAGKDGSAKSAPYAASKAAVIALTKAVGKELAVYDNILCNCVTPAAVKTAALMAQSEDDLLSHLAKIPKGRFCEPEEVAELVAWLASPSCSFSTGATFDISGGRATY